MNQPHDTIDSAFANLREMPIPDGPPPELLRQTIAAAQAASRPKKITTWSNLVLHIRKPIAAGFALIVIAVVALMFVRSSPVSYAQVVAKLNQAHLVRFEQVMGDPGSQPFVITWLDSDQGIEFVRLNNQRQIRDCRNGSVHTTTLFPDHKTAYVRWNDLRDWGRSALLDDFKAMAQAPSKDLGPFNLDGHSTEEFEVQRPGPVVGTDSGVSPDGHRLLNVKMENTTLVYHLWADRHTGDLVRVEKNFQIATHSMKTVYRNFVLDPQTAPADLSTDIPPDYKQIISGISTMAPADFQSAVVKSLHDYAASHNGQYPPDASSFPAAVTFKGTQAQFATFAQLTPAQIRSIHVPSSQAGPPAMHNQQLILMYSMSFDPPSPPTKSTSAPSAPPFDISFDTPPSIAMPVSKNVVWAWTFYGGKSATNHTLVLWFKDGDQFCCIWGDLSVKSMGGGIPADYTH
jgi:hypothetical protein